MHAVRLRGRHRSAGIVVAVRATARNPVYLSNLLVPGAARPTSRGLYHGSLDRAVKAETAIIYLPSATPGFPWAKPTTSRTSLED